MSGHFFIQQGAVDIQHFGGLGFMVAGLFQCKLDGFFFRPDLHRFERVRILPGGYLLALCQIKRQITE